MRAVRTSSQPLPAIGILENSVDQRMLEEYSISMNTYCMMVSILMANAVGLESPISQ